MGLLTGFAFAIFYTVAGVPVARLADLWVRRSVIAIGLALWSAMTALTGFSRSFVELALVRIGVGIGEAGGTPPSHALISDYFPPQRRATALGIFSLGVPLGTMLGYSLGGWLGEHYGWRAAFLWMGCRHRARRAGAAHGARAAPRPDDRPPASARRTTTGAVLRHSSRSRPSAGSCPVCAWPRSPATALRSGSRSS
jgi:MFS family permease